jgi:hypothetical protein
MAPLVLNPEVYWRLHDPSAKCPLFPLSEQEKRPGASGKQKNSSALPGVEKWIKLISCRNTVNCYCLRTLKRKLKLQGYHYDVVKATEWNTHLTEDCPVSSKNNRLKQFVFWKSVTLWLNPLLHYKSRCSPH